MRTKLGLVLALTVAIGCFAEAGGRRFPQLSRSTAGGTRREPAPRAVVGPQPTPSQPADSAAARAWEQGLSTAVSSSELDRRLAAGLRVDPARTLYLLVERLPDARLTDEACVRGLTLLSAALTSPYVVEIAAQDDYRRSTYAAKTTISPEARQTLQKRIAALRPILVDLLAEKLRNRRIDAAAAMGLISTFGDDAPLLWLLCLNVDHPTAVQYWRDELRGVIALDHLRFVADRQITVPELETFIERLDAHGIVAPQRLIAERDRQLSELKGLPQAPPMDAETLVFFLGLSGRDEDVAGDLAQLWQHDSSARLKALITHPRRF